MDLHAQCAAAGTEGDAIATVCDAEFLRKCLRKAGLDEELIADVADACELGELDALSLGCNQLSPQEAAERLFLTQDEAKALLHVCRRQCLRAGIQFGDGVVYEPGEDDEWLPEPDPNAPPPVVEAPPVPAAPPSNATPSLGQGAAASADSSDDEELSFSPKSRRTSDRHKLTQRGSLDYPGEGSKRDSLDLPSGTPEPESAEASDSNQAPLTRVGTLGSRLRESGSSNTLQQAPAEGTLASQLAAKALLKQQQKLEQQRLKEQQLLLQQQQQQEAQEALQAKKAGSKLGPQRSGRLSHVNSLKQQASSLTRTASAKATPVNKHLTPVSAPTRTSSLPTPSAPVSRPGSVQSPATPPAIAPPVAAQEADEAEPAATVASQEPAAATSTVAISTAAATAAATTPAAATPAAAAQAASQPADTPPAAALPPPTPEPAPSTSLTVAVPAPDCTPAAPTSTPSPTTALGRVSTTSKAGLSPTAGGVPLLAIPRPIGVSFSLTETPGHTELDADPFGQLDSPLPVTHQPGATSPAKPSNIATSRPPAEHPLPPKSLSAKVSGIPSYPDTTPHSARSAASSSHSASFRLPTRNPGTASSPRPQSATLPSTITASSALPSYARPTAAYTASVHTRIAEEVGADPAAATAAALGVRDQSHIPAAPGVNRSSTSRRTTTTTTSRIPTTSQTSITLQTPTAQAAVESDGKRPRRHVFAQISSSLLKPTKAFLAGHQRGLVVLPWLLQAWAKNGKADPPAADAAHNRQFKARPLPKFMTSAALRQSVDLGTLPSSARPSSAKPATGATAPPSRLPQASRASDSGCATSARTPVSSYASKGLTPEPSMNGKPMNGSANGGSTPHSKPGTWSNIPSTPQVNGNVPAATPPSAASAVKSGIPRAPGLTADMQPPPVLLS